MVASSVRSPGISSSTRLKDINGNISFLHNIVEAVNSYYQLIALRSLSERFLSVGRGDGDAYPCGWLTFIDFALVMVTAGDMYCWEYILLGIFAALDPRVQSLILHLHGRNTCPKLLPWPGCPKYVLLLGVCIAG